MREENQPINNIRQGDVCICSAMYNSNGSEQMINHRPCVVIQNNVGNQMSPTTLIIPLTKSNKKMSLPTHYELRKDNYRFLSYDSIALCEQIKCVDFSRLHRKIGFISDIDLRNIIKCVSKNFIFINVDNV